MRILTILCFFLLFCAARSQNDLSFSLYLVGDAGEHKEPGKALLLLKEQLLSDPHSAVIFLGDNVYPSGLKKNGRDSELHLESQLQVLKEYKGQVYFIPGNHDWSAEKANGSKILANQERYVKEYLAKTSIGNPGSTFLPANGLPGPETVLLKTGLRVVFIDTQWFLHAFKKNKIGTKKQTKELCYARLDSILNFSKQNNERVVIAAHHPLYSNGKHSKKLQPWRFLVNYTPFRIFGFMGLSRLFSQDLEQPRYKKMRNELLMIIGKHNNVVFASGHEHNLQYFKHGENHLVVSGSGSKTERLRKKDVYGSLFQDDSTTGFFKIEFEVEKMEITVYRVGEKEKKLKN